VLVDVAVGASVSVKVGVAVAVAVGAWGVALGVKVAVMLGIAVAVGAATKQPSAVIVAPEAVVAEKMKSRSRGQPEAQVVKKLPLGSTVEFPSVGLG